MTKNNTLYSQDVAYIHDSDFGRFATEAAKTIIEMLHNHQIDKGLVVDLGSGSGIVAKELLEHGYDVLGIEYSAEIIKIAQKKALGAKFIQGSFFDSQIPSCVAIVSTSECFNYLPGEKGEGAKKHHKSMLQALFQRSFDALQPGGLFIFDMLEPHAQLPRNSKRILEGKDWTMFLDIVEDAETEQLTRDITLFRQVGELYRKTKEKHHVQLYKRDQILAMLRECGFKVNIFGSYGDIMLDNHAGFLCQK